MPLSSFAKDYIAPHMSEFRNADIRDMSHLREESEFLVPTFMLNMIFRGSVNDATRRLMANFLRRTGTAFRNYESARMNTTDFLSSGTITAYMHTVSDWESFLS